MTEISSDACPEEIPDRVALEHGPHYFKWTKKIGVKIDGVVVFNCFEFCVSQGWARLGLTDNKGRWRKERGRTTCVMKYGKIEPYWR